MSDIQATWHTEDCLVVWSPDLLEKPLDLDWHSLVRRKAAIYLYQGDFPKPIFSCPTESAITPGLIEKESNNAAILIANKDRQIQDPRWQIAELQKQMNERGIRTAEIIGEPGCIEMLAGELHAAGFIIKLSTINGSVRRFTPQL